MKEIIIARNKKHLEFLTKHEIAENCYLNGDEKGCKCDLNHIDTSLITDMSGLFANSKYNGDISQWNVSSVTNMISMFQASFFNGDISKWDVSNVKTMGGMFFHSNFNRNINKWNVSNVKNMGEMFAYSQFNKNLNKWDVSSVEDMQTMFSGSRFTKDISSWNPISCKKSLYMLKDCKAPDPWWYSEDAEEIKRKLQLSELHHHLNNELPMNSNISKKIKI